MAEPFQFRKLRERTFTDRLMKRHPEGNAAAAINNLLAAAGSIHAVSEEAVAGEVERYSYGYKRAGLLSIFREYIEYALKQERLLARHWDCLEHLERILKIERSTAGPLLHEMRRSSYRAIVHRRIGSRTLSRGESDRVLNEHRVELGLSGDEGHQIFIETAKWLVLKMTEEALLSQEVSPDLEEAIHQVAALIYCSPSDPARLPYFIPEDQQKRFRKARLMWEIRHRELRPIPTKLNLRAGEFCFMEFSAQWCENRTGDPRQTMLTMIDAGKAYITNKRLIFIGKKKNTAMRLSFILDFKIFAEGIELYKSAGKPVFLAVIDGSVEFAAHTLTRMLKGDLKQ